MLKRRVAVSFKSPTNWGGGLTGRKASGGEVTGGELGILLGVPGAAPQLEPVGMWLV